MIMMFTCGRQMFPALKSSVVQLSMHLHRFTPTMMSAKSMPPRNSFQLFCITIPTSCHLHTSNRKLSAHFAFKVINFRNVLSLEQSIHNRLMLSTARTFATSSWRLSTRRSGLNSSNKTGLIYIIAVFIFMLGGAYAGVPLYKVFCQATGIGGQAVKGHDTSKIETMEKVERPIVVRFNADVASSMRWNFRPLQTEVTVYPGETALAFYTAKNPTDKPIIGISTYNILPNDAGQYFNKIQCFCFEEQRLNPNEQVDMPVFFYIDPEFVDDPKLQHVKSITLSYTFFEAREGLQLPLPGYLQSHNEPVTTAS